MKNRGDFFVGEEENMEKTTLFVQCYPCKSTQVQCLRGYSEKNTIVLDKGFVHEQFQATCLLMAGLIFHCVFFKKHRLRDCFW